MTTDLVDRLRRGSVVFKELGDAADEIDRLRKALRDEQALDCGCPCCAQHVGIADEAIGKLEE